MTFMSFMVMLFFALNSRISPTDLVEDPLKVTFRDILFWFGGFGFLFQDEV